MKKERGITLVILVITVVILLLLASVAISEISNDNGLFKSMKNLTSEEEKKAKNTQEDIKFLENNL